MHAQGGSKIDATVLIAHILICLTLRFQKKTSTFCITLRKRRPVYIAASKERLRKIQIIFYAVRISISLAILPEIFIQIGYFF